MLYGMPFSPSLIRTVVYLVILLVLMIPFTKKTIYGYFAEESSTSESGSDIAKLSLVLFGFGMVLIIQPFIMPGTHVIDGVIYYGFEGLQFIGGLLCLLFGLIGQLGHFSNYREKGVSFSNLESRSLPVFKK